MQTCLAKNGGGPGTRFGTTGAAREVLHIRLAVCQQHKLGLAAAGAAVGEEGVVAGVVATRRARRVGRP